MTKTNNIETITGPLDYTNGMVTLDTIPNKIQSSSTKYNLAKQTFETISEVEGIYFSGEYPLIYFKILNDFDPVTIKALHKQIWNQGRVPLMFISCPHELRIYNCFDKPLKDDENLEKLQIDRFERNVDEFIRLESLYHQSRMDSGLYWDSASGKRIIQAAAKKVDKLLLNNLKNLRSRLISELSDKIDDPIPYIHNVLGRSLFILYLEDRGVISKDYYEKFLKGANEYFDILESKSASYDLFTELNIKFNGDIFKVTSGEKRVIGLQQLKLIRDCFYGHDVLTGQQTFWRMFDFNYIPIELLSAIYEEFLHTAEGDDAISNQGAYYTPQPLVEFVLNEVLPFPDENNKDYNVKILDPACGSGIFLVEAYRRLIERWRYVHPGKRMSIDPLRSILLNSIFGIEKNSEAIKVASFSLYLTILHYLEPKYIWERVKFPYLVQSDERDEDHRGQNLFQGDTFELTNYYTIEFDLIVGNPPWKRGNLDESVNQYLKKHSLGNEVVLAFLHKMAFTARKAKIALVSTAKILFNSTSGYEEFRRFLFNDTKVDVVVNFAALRKSRGEIGRKLFASATGPTVVIFYNGVDIVERNDTIIYCTPKPNFKDTSLNELVIDASDVKYIPQDEAADPNTKVWKVAMWGTMRDFNLIKFINKNERLYQFFDKNKWAYGNGFQLSNPCDKIDKRIKDLPNIENAQVTQYYTSIDSTITIANTKFRRFGCVPAYRAPHMLIKRGQNNKEFCASYLDYDCSFRDGVYGVASDRDELLKALTGYLNSRFATYYLFLTSASWGIEREQIFATEVFDVPAPRFLVTDEGYEEIEQLVTTIISKQKEFTLGVDQVVRNLKKEIDKAVLKDLGFNQNQQILIDNLINYSLDFFQEGSNSQAILPTTKADIIRYAKTSCKNLVKFLRKSQINFWATLYKVDYNSPLLLMSLHFNNRHESGSVEVDETTDVSLLLNKLNKIVYNRYSESIYFRRVIKHYDSDTLFIVKPNEKRFWTEAMALEDSDTVALEMMSVVNG